MSLSFNTQASFNAVDNANNDSAADSNTTSKRWEHSEPSEKKSNIYYYKGDAYYYFPPSWKTRLRLINPGTVATVSHVLQGKERREFMKALRQNGEWGQPLAMHEFAKAPPAKETIITRKAVDNDTDTQASSANFGGALSPNGNTTISTEATPTAPKERTASKPKGGKQEYTYTLFNETYKYIPPRSKKKLRFWNRGDVYKLSEGEEQRWQRADSSERWFFKKFLVRAAPKGTLLANIKHNISFPYGEECIGTKDNDDDGIINLLDKCKDVPGTEEYIGCPPPADTDGDGFLDHEDTCPREAGVMPDGCPVIDRDADGFPDDIDSCKDVPETINGFDDKDGCPDEPPSFADLKSTDFFTKVDHRDLLLLLAVAENEFNRDTKANLVKVPPSDANYQAVTENRRILINAIKTAFKSLVRAHYQNSTNSSLTKLENHAAQITELWVNGDISKKDLSELQKYTFEILGKTSGLKIFPKPIKMERS